MNAPHAPRTGLILTLLYLSGTLALAIPLMPARAQQVSSVPACEVPGPLDGIVARGGPHGELVLDDGTSLRPADLWIETADALLPAGTRITYRRIGRAPDRWGRWAARIEARAGGAGGWLDRTLVAQGRALVRPETAEDGCIAALLAAEAQARAASLGIWADGTRPVAADNLTKLSQKVGTYVVAEGFVHTVGVRQRQTYLNFGRRWSENLAVAMPKALWTQATSRSMTAPDLQGRRVRVRGVLEHGSGPLIRLGRLDEIELLGDR